jgi:hypothetical protein
VDTKLLLRSLPICALLLATVLPARAQITTKSRFTATISWSLTTPWSSCTAISPSTAARPSSTACILPTTPNTETIEITHGFTDWLEAGFYIFTSERSGQGIQWVGDHIRPRIAVPKKWKWPVGLSLSNELGYQRRQFSTDTWTWEMRPIVDKQLGRWYLSLNPTFDKSSNGQTVGHGFVFSPNFKISSTSPKKSPEASNTMAP